MAYPYQYMENLTDRPFANWLKIQATHVRKVLGGIPGRQGLLDKLREFDGRKSVRTYQVLVTDNDKYFYIKETPEDETGKPFFSDGFAGKVTLPLIPKTIKRTLCNTSYRNSSHRSTDQRLPLK